MAKGIWLLCSNGAGGYATVNYTAADALVDAAWSTATTDRQYRDSSNNILAVIYGILFSTATVNSGVVTGGTISATTGSLNGVPPPEDGIAVLTIVATGNDNVVFPNVRTVIIEGLAGAGSITGIAAGRDGQKLTLINNVAQNLELTTNSASSAAGNQFEITQSGNNPTTTGIGTFELIYSSVKGGWIQTFMTA